MITILLGIVFAIFLGRILTNSSGTPSPEAFSIPAAIITISILVGLKTPLSGFGEWEERKREELLPLSSSELVYVHEKDDIYIYKLLTTPKFEKEEVDKEDVIVQVVQEENCSTPSLIMSERKALRSWWTFARNISEWKYTFIVPKGTVISEF